MPDALPTGGEEDQVQRAEEVGDQVERGRQLHHRGVGGLVEEEDHDEQLDDQRGQQLRGDRGAGGVDATQLLRQQVVLRHQRQRLGAEHLPGDVGAEHGDAQTGGDQPAAPGADDQLQHLGHGVVSHRREVLAGCHAVGQEAHQQQQDEHREEAEQGRQGDIPPGLGAPGVRRRALDTDERPHGEQHHALDLGGQAGGLVAVVTEGQGASPEVCGEDLGVETQEGHQDEEGGDRQQFRRGGDQVHHRGLPDSPGQYGEDRPVQHGDAEGVEQQVASVEDGEEVGQGAEEQRGVTDLGDDRGQPVAPAGGEADEVAEAGTHIAVHAGVQVRLALGEGLEDEGDAQHADARDRPTDDRRTRRGNVRHVLRQREDAGADAGAEDQGDQDGEADGVFTVPGYIHGE